MFKIYGEREEECKYLLSFMPICGLHTVALKLTVQFEKGHSFLMTAVLDANLAFVWARTTPLSAGTYLDRLPCA